MIREDYILEELVIKKSKKLNVVLCGYRSWAVEIMDGLLNNPRVNIVAVIKTYEDYQANVNKWKNDIDFILFLGWSWIIPKEITAKYLCIGVHPSDLPAYRGGSPLQHQIIAGVLDSKVTLMTLSSEKLDGGEIWLKEDFDLRGDSIAEIFENLVKSSTILLQKFIDLYPNIKPIQPNLKEGSYHKRRKPENSKINTNHIQAISLRELYNFIRALTDPYPNAYLEDAEGNRLLFTGVKYIPKD